MNSVPQVTCHTGTYVGTREKETGVFSFKGIPYAVPISPSLRWMAPLPLPSGNQTFSADSFGKSCIQTGPFPFDQCSEDCLTLNIWTKNFDKKNKTVLFFIHGGSYGWGTSNEPVYDGQYLADHFDDIIIVTCNYRVNLFGFLDLSDVPGGETYTSSAYNGVLDCLQALQFVHENIEAFGGNPDDVTIFGESAGGGMVSLLMTSPASKNLFHRVIAQSGTINLSFSLQTFKENHQTEELLRLTHSKNMSDLLKLSGYQIYQAMQLKTRYKGKEGLSTLDGLNNHPLTGSGSVLPASPLTALQSSPAQDIDLMIGTVTDEFRMWVTVQRKRTLQQNFISYYRFLKDKLIQIRQHSSSAFWQNIRYALSAADAEFDIYARKFPGIWNMTDVLNEYFFRIPAIQTAEWHINSKSRTYMYLFAKPATLNNWQKACHACEVPYVFHHLKHNTFCGDVDAHLAHAIAASWVAFAKTGNPSTCFAEWSPYTLPSRNTMYINPSGHLSMISDPKKTQRTLLMTDEMMRI